MKGVKLPDPPFNGVADDLLFQALLEDLYQDFVETKTLVFIAIFLDTGTHYSCTDFELVSNYFEGVVTDVLHKETVRELDKLEKIGVVVYLRI